MTDDLPLPGVLRQRALLLRTLRRTLEERGFLEVETPVRILAPANELHLDAPPSGKAFLRTSPELQMKRLLCAGLPLLYQMGPCFREGERGPRHNPEFTLLEWYRAGSGSEEVLQDLQAMVSAAAMALHDSTRFRFGGQEIDVSLPWESLTVREAFQRFAGWDPVSGFDPDRFDHDLVFKVEPALPRDCPCVLRDYPAPVAALSRLCPHDPRLADRWEMYLGGIELCNAFGELADPVEQRRRFEETAAARHRMGAVAYPLDEAFLDALRHPGLPPSGGAALGVDRLCMVLLDCADIAQVRAFCPPIGGLW